MRNVLAMMVIAVLFILITATATAQVVKPAVTVGFNLIYSNPLGDFRNSFKYGFGGEVYGGVGRDKTFVIATVGYRLFGIEDDPFECTTVKLGVKQFVLMKKIFVQGDVGIASVKRGGAVQTAFAPGIGAGVRLGGVELGLYYDTFKWKIRNVNAGSVNIKAGFSFSL